MTNHFSLTYEKLSEAFQAEINNFANAVMYLGSQNSIGNITQYSKLLKNQSKNKSSFLPIIEASKGSAILDMSNVSTMLTELIYTAHVGACSLLINDSQFTEQQLQPDAFKSLAMASFPVKEEANDEILSSIANQLATLDASRTMQLLRVLGLITRQPEKMVQLALGCGSGINDYGSIHREAQIQIINSGSQSLYEFKSIAKHPKSITMIDGDEVHAERYKHYNEGEQPIKAIVGDMVTTLGELDAPGVEKANFVSVLRMEYRMIPDVKMFFNQLSKLISNDCDFVFSVGSGDSLEDFEGRTKIVNEVYEYLKAANLRPMILKMHEPGDLDHQWASLKFGSPSLATYEILHCKLNNKALMAAL